MARRRLSASHKAAIARSLRGNRNAQGASRVTRGKQIKDFARDRIITRRSASRRGKAFSQQEKRLLAVNMAVASLGTAGAMYLANKPLGPVFNGKVASAGRFGKNKGVFNISTGRPRKANF